MHEVRRQRYPSGAPFRRWQVLVFPDGREEKDGPEVEWTETGEEAARRAWSLGEPVGTWTSWHPNGAKRSEHVHPPQTDLGGGREGVMTWWHENGALAARGGLIDDIREGPWTFWHPNGQVSEQGSYVNGLRQGPWTYWWEDGSLRAEGEHDKNRRAPGWRTWDREGNPVIGAPPETDATPER